MLMTPWTGAVVRLRAPGLHAHGRARATVECTDVPPRARTEHVDVREDASAVPANWQRKAVQDRRALQHPVIHSIMQQSMACTGTSAPAGEAAGGGALVATLTFADGLAGAAGRAGAAAAGVTCAGSRLMGAALVAFSLRCSWLAAAASAACD